MLTTVCISDNHNSEYYHLLLFRSSSYFYRINSSDVRSILCVSEVGDPNELLEKSDAKSEKTQKKAEKKAEKAKKEKAAQAAQAAEKAEAKKAAAAAAAKRELEGKHDPHSVS